MKHGITFALLAALAVSLSAAEPAATQIQLTSPGFEEGTKNWLPYGRQPKNPQNPVLSLTDDAASGKKALKVHDEWQDVQPYAIQFFKLPPAPGRRVTIACMAKAAKGHAFKLGSQFLSENTYLGADFKTLTGTGNWTKYTVVLTPVPEQTCRFTVAVFPTAGSVKDTGDVLIDDVAVTVDKDPAAFFPEPADKAKLAGKQIELCMVGDSITWIGVGDYFRALLLKEIPNLAFVGTHTAMLGFSHAGEGGDNTYSCLKTRIDDPAAIPDSRYYHVLMGVNDSAPHPTSTDEQIRQCKADVEKRAAAIAGRLMTMCEHLLKRPGTEKVFLGTILPCVHDRWPNVSEHEKFRYEVRDLTASTVNRILRAEAGRRFGGKVIIVEYEKHVRAMADWKTVIRLHPTLEGYTRIAPILAKALKENTTPANGKSGSYGILIDNRWDAAANKTKLIIPGHYVVSFVPENVQNGKITFTLAGDGKGIAKWQKPASYNITATGKSGERCQTIVKINGPRQYYELKNASCKLDKIMIEKMRPDKKMSPYCADKTVDTTLQPYLGEQLVPAK